jgi:hypothetical protein
VDGAVPDGSSAMLCAGDGVYEVCVPRPANTVALTGEIDTAASTLCATSQPAAWMAAGQPEACFIVGMDIRVDAGQTALFFGTRPLVLVGGAITITGTLDVSSHRDPASLGPGANSGLCQAFARSPGDSSSGAAGGAGGSFMSKGGDGGDGRSNTTEGLAAAADAAPPARLRGGCRGQQGGEGDDPPPLGGDGGGAVYLGAETAITITGAINASGAGARGGPNQDASKAGGSGGGSGGMIKLHAPTIVAVGGVLMANGGGGASGNNDPNVGQPGSDPQVTAPNTPAPGGARVSNSGLGGAGFAGGTAATSGGTATGNNTGGGGGGGGGGYIESNRSLAGATTSAGLVQVP